MGGPIRHCRGPILPLPARCRPCLPIESRLCHRCCGAAWTGLGMSPADAPLSAAALRGQPADAALAAALLAAKSEASAAQERLRAAALAWERERTAVDASALRVAEAEHFLRASSGRPVVPEPGASSFRQAPPAGSGARYDPTDPMVAQLHLQAAGVQNIRALVTVLLDPTSSSYERWRD